MKGEHWQWQASGKCIGATQPPPPTTTHQLAYMSGQWHHMAQSTGEVRGEAGCCCYQHNNTATHWQSLTVTQYYWVLYVADNTMNELLLIHSLTSCWPVIIGPCANCSVVWLHVGSIQFNLFPTQLNKSYNNNNNNDINVQIMCKKRGELKAVLMNVRPPPNCT